MSTHDDLPKREVREIERTIDEAMLISPYPESPPSTLDYPIFSPLLSFSMLSLCFLCQNFRPL